jgi:hypothetical protein
MTCLSRRSRGFDKEMPQKLGYMFADWEGRRVSVDRYKVIADSRG